MLALNFAHAFGQRYELPIPLALFVGGGALVVLISFLLVIGRSVDKPKGKQPASEEIHLKALGLKSASLSWIVTLLLAVTGIVGSQEIPENILPTVFWLLVWIAVPLSCGLIGDWTQSLNPFANLAKLFDSNRLRQLILAREKLIRWPEKLGWWPAVALYFALACGELIYNQFATLPKVIGISILVYGAISAAMGLLFGRVWLQRGEVFSILFRTWGRLGYFRFGSFGNRGFGGELENPFESSVSRVLFVLLLLVSVSFDGLLSTPTWSRWQNSLPSSIQTGSVNLKLLTTLAFVVLAGLIWTLFISFASGVARVIGNNTRNLHMLAGLLPSLLPISFGYLLAHNLEYLIVNGQLMFPLIGNPTGKDSWPIHLPHPFNDSFEPHIHLLPSSFYWYLAVLVIIAVHVMAVVMAHKYLGRLTARVKTARRSEYPWLVAMIAYTMLSLWLIAQPLVKEKSDAAIQSTKISPDIAQVYLSGTKQ